MKQRLFQCSLVEQTLLNFKKEVGKAPAKWQFYYLESKKSKGILRNADPQDLTTEIRFRSGDQETAVLIIHFRQF